MSATRLSRITRRLDALTATGTVVAQVAHDLREALKPPRIRYDVWTGQTAAVVTAQRIHGGIQVGLRLLSGAPGSASLHVNPADHPEWHAQAVAILNGTARPPTAFPLWGPARIVDYSNAAEVWPVWTANLERVCADVVDRVLAVTASTEEIDAIYERLGEALDDDTTVTALHAVTVHTRH